MRLDPRLVVAASILRHLALVAVSCSGSSTLFAPQALAQGCPTSTLRNAFCSSSTQAATMDTTCGEPGFSSSAHGHFDLVQDTLTLVVDTPYCPSSGELAVAERFRLLGGTPGTPIPFTLRMPLQAGLYASWTDAHITASGTAKLEVDGVVVAQATQTRDCDFLPGCTDTGNLGSPLTAALSIPPGQDFIVVARLSGAVDLESGCIANPGLVVIRAGLHFDDLPAGTAVVSCHGDTIGTVGVEDGQAAGALRFLSAGANPSRGPISVAFFAPRAGPVTLRLLDISGRKVESVLVDAPAAGIQTAILGERRTAAPGAYIVRLTQGAVSRSKLVTVIR